VHATASRRPMPTLGRACNAKSPWLFRKRNGASNRRRRPIFRVVVRTKRFPGGVKPVAIDYRSGRVGAEMRGPILAHARCAGNATANLPPRGSPGRP
jgi:hypothetical protein